MSKSIGWDERLFVGTGGKGLVGHAGAVLLRQCADRTGLTRALSAVIPKGKGPGWWDRGTAVVCLAVSIVLGATSMCDINLLAHQVGVFGDPPSQATIRGTLAALDEAALKRIAKARAKVRRRVWDLLAKRPAGFPWLCVAGKLLTGWVVIDLDATLITAHSVKQGAAATFKKGYGFHPLGAWCANTVESLAMLLRPGNAGSNTVADHIRVLGEALVQVPLRYRHKILIRIDGAGATYELLEHLQQMNTAWRTVRFTVGWTITDTDDDAISRLPESAWTDSPHQDGTPTDQAGVAELTGVNTRTGRWMTGLRLIVRRTKPARRHRAKLTALESAPAGGTPSSPPTSPACGVWPDPTSHNGSTVCTVHTPQWKIEFARTRPWGYVTCHPSHGRSTAAGSWRPTSPPTSTPGPACSACTTSPTLPKPNPKPCATACCTCPPSSPPTPDAAG